jgi:hypothetical protein
VKVSLVSRFGLIVLAILLVTTPSRADDEKIFHFKNGRKVLAEILEETATNYVVRTAGGRSVFAKDSIASIEEVPAPGKSFLGGPAEKPKEKPAAGDATPAPSAAEPLASEAEIASARRALGAVPAENPDDPQAAGARTRALAAVSDGCPLGALVALCAEITVPTPRERFLALDLVIAAGERARPLLAQAILAADARALPRELLVAIQKVGPDATGTIERAVLAKLAELRTRKTDPAGLGPVLKAVGSERSLAALYDWLLAPERPDTSATLSEICQAVVGAQSSPDAALQPLVRLLDTKDLPGYRKLSAALDVLSKTRGEAVPAVSAILDQLEASPSKDAERPLALASGYAALASVPTDAARERLMKSLRSASGAEGRLLVLGAMKKQKPTAGWPTPDTLEAIRVSMAEADRSPAEREAYAQVLASLTGRSLGTDPAAWSAYILGLRH